MKNIFFKQPILSALVLAALALALLFISQVIILSVFDEVKYGSGIILLSYALPLLLVVGVAGVLGLWDKFKFSTQGWLKGVFWLGLPLLFFAVLSAFGSYTSTEGHENVNPAFISLIFFSAYMLLIGIFEEFLCRGVILNSMLKKWGDSKNGMIKAVIWSSLIFGLAHLVNLFGAPDMVIATISQVIYATFLGIFFAAIYIRTRNIWVVASLHALFNWAGMIWFLFFPTAAPTGTVDVEIWVLFGQMILTMPFAVFGFWYISKTWKSTAAEIVYPTVTCPTCQNRLPAEDDYCLHCGTSLKFRCASCKQPALPNDAYCRLCGSLLNNGTTSESEGGIE